MEEKKRKTQLGKYLIRTDLTIPVTMLHCWSKICKVHKFSKNQGMINMPSRFIGKEFKIIIIPTTILQEKSIELHKEEGIIL